MFDEKQLTERLITPSARLAEDMKKLSGSLLVLGAGGKMGPTLCALARRAGVEKVTAVSRFSDPEALKLLHDEGVRTISADLLEPGVLDHLPDADHVIFMAGRKFGTDGQEPYTWAMNAWLPTLAAQRYRNANTVVFSSGNIYPLTPAASGGATEQTPIAAVGEYPQSVLARERIYEYASLAYGTKVLLFRLNFAIDLRYGVLYDIASKVLAGEEIALGNSCFNCIWQGDANEAALRSLLHTASPAARLNVTGPETISVRYAAERFAKLFGCEAKVTGEEKADAVLSNSAHMVHLMGYPSTGMEEMIDMQAEWLLSGGRTLNKPTHFEQRGGKF